MLRYPLEEVDRGDRAFAVGADHPHLGVADDRRRRVLRGGIGMGHRAAHGAAVADLGMAHELRRRVQQGLAVTHQRRLLHSPLGRHGAYHDAVAAQLDAVDALDAPQVHEQVRMRQPEVQHGHQALPARQDDGIAVGISQQRHRLADLCRCLVVEGAGFMESSLDRQPVHSEIVASVRSVYSALSGNGRPNQSS
ncbi:MAG: hypothetical protein M5U19_21120 [Microthrixaceae bacterium]|nr:hypothetical protein [Microthrixaceae bacterium]